MTFRDSVAGDPWPWIFRALTATLLFFVGISAYLAEQTLSDIRSTAKATLSEMSAIARQTDQNTYSIREIDRDCCGGRHTDP